MTIKECQFRGEKPITEWTPVTEVTIYQNIGNERPFEEWEPFNKQLKVVVDGNSDEIRMWHLWNRNCAGVSKLIGQLSKEEINWQKRKKGERRQRQKGFSVDRGNGVTSVFRYYK